ncbi:sensor domain-containing diguanylate cyclase [Dyella sp. C11]|uniref:sensor domain-containing diguanylate cyclase n=1 Tax=Dyella sp. C11 TaxID=2126991 RepID=UPI0018E51046|nr:sensor domain-containing diguanylate cyclase [Dyella sp. C11]
MQATRTFRHVMAMHDIHQRRHARLALLAESAGLFAAVLVAVSYSLLLARHTGSVVTIWITNGIVLGALLAVQRSKWPAYLVAAFLGFLAGQHIGHGGLMGQGVALPLALGLTNGVEILTVATVVRHVFPRIADDTRFLLLGRIALGSTLVACVVSALLAATIQRAAHGQPFWITADWWFRAHLLGMVIVGTLTLVALLQRRRMLGRPGRRLLMLRDIVGLTAITAAVFAQSSFPLLFVVFAPLLYVVFQHRFPGLVIGIALISLITTAATALGTGPFQLIVPSTPSRQAMLAQVYLGVLCITALPVALALADRRRLARRVTESESRYRLLADYASDLVMRIARDGSRRYVSPSVHDLLGWEVHEFMPYRAELIHPDDRERVAAAVQQLWETRRPSLTQYRLQRRSGDYIWIEALVRVVPSLDQPGEMELIYTGRDITEAMEAEQALADSEKRLRTITDNVPAVIAHIDAHERYTFVNGYVREVTGGAPEDMVGRTVEEIRGPVLYPVLKPHIERALRGETDTFEYEAEYAGRRHHFQTTYLPATTGNGQPNGFYALTTEITHIKQAEQQLSYLAHYDVLTGIANRRYFSEGINMAVHHAAIANSPLLVMLIDIDHFKQINDTYGHAAGDAVLSEIASRLKASIRKTDLLARLGGDEFVVLCDDIDSQSVAETLAQKITRAMDAPIVTGPHRLKVTLSVGAALCRDAGSVDALMQKADEALYRAKERGRACYELSVTGL